MAHSAAAWAMTTAPTTAALRPTPASGGKRSDWDIRTGEATAAAMRAKAPNGKAVDRKARHQSCNIHQVLATTSIRLPKTAERMWNSGSSKKAMLCFPG